MGGDAGTFGKQLRKLRNSSGMSQQALADRSGLSVRSISNMESGKTRCPYPDSVARIADALGLHAATRAQLIAVIGQRAGQDPEPVPASAAQAYVPRLIPARISSFSGRDGELRTLRRMTGDGGETAPVATITGVAGIGKTALAVQWARQAATEFPDGQLFIDLGGFGPPDALLEPADAARVLLDALRIPTSQVPATGHGQLGLFRSLLADRRMLVILDNARDVAQVRPLLPGGSVSRVIVTSRDRLLGLSVFDGARPLPLDPLTGSEARQLLTRRLGASRLAAEQKAADQIITACAGLPLALGVIAARAEFRPDLPLARITGGLAGQRPLDALSGTGHPAADIRISFSWSYERLDAEAARAFRAAGLHPGDVLDPHTVSALTGVTPEQAARALETLAHASLIQPAGHEQYTIHRLLQAYAREQAHQHKEGSGT